MADCGNTCPHEIGILKGKLDGIQRAIDEHQSRMDNIDLINQAHLAAIHNLERSIEKRLDQLERKQYAIYAIAAFIGTVASIVVKFI